MGTPDAFACECINCGIPNFAQTKLFGNTLEVIRPNTKIDYCSEELKNCILELKENCFNCNTFFRVLILNGVYKGLVVFEPTHKEHMWGKYESLS